MKNTLKLGGLVLLGCGMAQGSVILSETFDALNTGNLHNQNGWSGIYGTSPQVVDPGFGGLGKGLSQTGTVNGGLKKSLGQTYNPAGTATMYLSANLIWDGSAQGQFMMGLSEGNNTNKVEIRFNSNGLQAYVRDTPGYTTFAPNTMVVGKSYMAVAKFTPVDAASFNLSFNLFELQGGALGAESAYLESNSIPLPLENGSTPYSLTSMNMGVSTSSMFADNVLASDSWADVQASVAVPEPSAALLGAFGLIGLLRRRR